MTKELSPNELPLKKINCLEVKKFLCFYTYLDMEEGIDIVNIDEHNLMQLLQTIVNKLQITENDLSID